MRCRGSLEEIPEEEALSLKPRLLVVPHIYAEDIVVREIELARRLAAHFEVFVLRWHDAHRVHAAAPLLRRLKQVRATVSAAFHRRHQQDSGDGVTLVEAPLLQPLLFQRFLGPVRAERFSQFFNRRPFHSLVKHLGVTHLLLANDFCGVDRIPGVRTFFDFVDWFPEENIRPSRLEMVCAHFRSIGENVDGVFGVSEPLCERLEEACGVHASPLPNGADLAGLRGITPERVRELRQSLGLGSRFVLGYVGNHATFTGVDLAVNAYLAVRSRMPDAALLIVGPAEPWRDLLESHRSHGVIATGGVSPAEIGVYFNLLDLGLLAQGKSAGTDYAFQIKVVEYSACRKCVVSTPLDTWQRLAWPNVVLAEPDPSTWANAFVRARSIRWRADWDRIVEPYDWSALADKAASVMLAGPVR